MVGFDCLYQLVAPCSMITLHMLVSIIIVTPIVVCCASLLQQASTIEEFSSKQATEFHSCRTNFSFGQVLMGTPRSGSQLIFY
jgi:hypothetical protein